MAIDLVLGADNLHAPLTGIGRYTYELSCRLKANENIDRLRFFALGRWVSDPLVELEKDIFTGVMGSVFQPNMKVMLASQPWAVKIYNVLSPAVFSWQLRGIKKNSIFHSPNFLVPSCAAKKVTTVHDLSHEMFPHFHPYARVQLMADEFPKSLDRSDHIITVSEAVRQELLVRYPRISSHRVTAINLAADDIYYPRSVQMLAPVMQNIGLRAGNYCLFVGTVEPRKNIEQLIQAYELLPLGMRKEWPLVVAGGKGWNSDSIHARMAKAQAEGWLRYLSFIDQRWLPALYAGARLMAYPSLYEGFGLPIVEAMASGTPVLTSNTSCMPEVAGGAAYLVNPHDVDDIRHGLEHCLSDEAWQADARVKGLARAAQLSWDRCASETIAVYQKLV